ncbi:MAG: ABC transporter ATP-binding protein [Armatimonadetes bacterium]|nr:ABC transporter ATP-binding protein [Armatimonadota bacterium]
MTVLHRTLPREASGMADSRHYAIETKALTKRFGKHVAVDNLTLRVPTGSVFAFLGRNGAGKTTTIRILLDLLNRTSGEASILGLDCVKDSLEIKRRIGYVAEGQKMYDWMKVDEIIWFCKGFYSDWDDAFAAELKHKLELPGSRKIGEMSRGMQAKLALLLAMAYRPELLILDEPTAGLDVVVRRDFLEGVIELIQEQGRTVFFSSHIVHEVERVADWVGIIDKGKLIWCSPMEELKSSIKRLVLNFDEPPASFSAIPNVLTVESSGRQSEITVKDFSPQAVAAAKSLGPTDIRVEDLGLEDIFVALVGKSEE